LYLIDDFDLSTQLNSTQRAKLAVEPFAGTGTGSIKQFHGLDPPSFRIRVGDYRVRNRREAYR
jgi:hypothetical protein